MAIGTSNWSTFFFLRKMQSERVQGGDGGERSQTAYRMVVCRRTLVVQISKGRAEDQVVEAEEGKLLCELQGGIEKGCGWL